MSAIFGLIGINGQQVDAHNLELMNKAVGDLGADGGAIWLANNAGLGQRQMLFTPEDSFERQPLHSHDGRFVLVSDARIDNRAELGAELGISAAEAREMPDGAFILRAYEKWGQDCATHLIGAFVFAVWNSQTQTLFMARSALQERVVFYHASPQFFAFASMPKGLLVLPWIERRLNEEKVADFLLFNHKELHTTFYRDIYRLAHAHALTMRSGGLTTRQYWQPDLKREIRLPRDEDYLAAFTELFERVVSDNLRSITPVGIMMSGGLDSSSIAAVAASQLMRQNKRLFTFTETPRAGFNGPTPAGRYADETPFVQAMARMYKNIDPVFVPTSGRSLLHNVDRFFDYAEVPFRNGANRVWYEALFEAAQRKGVRVLINGAQGNLTISYNGAGLLPQLLRRGRWLRALHEARAQRKTLTAAGRTVLSQGVWPLLPAPLGRVIARARGQAYALSWRAIMANTLIGPGYDKAQRVDERTPSLRELYVPGLIANSKFMRYDSMANLDMGGDPDTGYRAMFGVDTRTLLADTRLIEFCLALPEDQYMRDGKTRWLIQRAMWNRLPGEILSNHKRGLQAADWYETLDATRPEIGADMIRLEQSEVAQRALDLPRLRQMLGNWPQGNWGDPSALRDYRTIFEAGIMMGRFLLWFEAGA